MKRESDEKNYLKVFPCNLQEGAKIASYWSSNWINISGGRKWKLHVIIETVHKASYATSPETLPRVLGEEKKSLPKHSEARWWQKKRIANMIACLISINDLHPNLIFSVCLMIFLIPLASSVCVCRFRWILVEGRVKARKISRKSTVERKKIKTFHHQASRGLQIVTAIVGGIKNVLLLDFTWRQQPDITVRTRMRTMPRFDWNLLECECTQRQHNGL